MMKLFIQFNDAFLHVLNVYGFSIISYVSLNGAVPRDKNSLPFHSRLGQIVSVGSSPTTLT